MDYKVSKDLPAVPAPAPAPAPAVPNAPSGANAHLWTKPDDHDLVVVCGKNGWLVHRHVLVSMSEGWMEKHLPPASEDQGTPVYWVADPVAWNPGRLEAILRFMYLEEYPGGRYDPKKPLATECIMHNVAHYIAGAAVLCRPMMDFAIDRIEEATAEIVKKLPSLRHAQLDSFEYGIRMALLNMYAEPDQWRIRALRIVIGKLMAACAHIILQSPSWAPKFEKLWGALRVRVVADHKWLYQAGLCERNAVIMHGFENMSIRWKNYRGENWQPADDLMFPEDEVDTLPKPPPQSPPSTPHRKKKMSKAIPIVSPGGTIAPRPNRGRGRGRGVPTGLVEPAPQPVRGKGKQVKMAQGPEKAATRATDEAGPSSTTKAAPTTIAGPTNEGGPSSAAARDDPFASDDANIAYWAKIASKSNFPLPDLGSASKSGPSARRASSPSRPSSSSSALSATAEPFLPGGPLHSAESSARRRSSSITHADAQTSTDYLESPSRLEDLYDIGEDELDKHQGKGKEKEVAGGPATPGSSFSQSEGMEVTSEPSTHQEATGQMALDLSSLEISKNDDEETRRSASPAHGSQSENDI
ncbi:hypothetical protein SLS64_004176 [Diaporthe eres]